MITPIALGFILRLTVDLCFMTRFSFLVVLSFNCISRFSFRAKQLIGISIQLFLTLKKFFSSSSSSCSSSNSSSSSSSSSSFLFFYISFDLYSFSLLTLPFEIFLYCNFYNWKSNRFVFFRFLCFCGLRPIPLLQGWRKPKKTLQVLINFIPDAPKILVPDRIWTKDPCQRKKAR